MRKDKIREIEREIDREIDRKKEKETEGKKDKYKEKERERKKKYIYIERDWNSIEDAWKWCGVWSKGEYLTTLWISGDE